MTTVGMNSFVERQCKPEFAGTRLDGNQLAGILADVNAYVEDCESPNLGGQAKYDDDGNVIAYVIAIPNCYKVKASYVCGCSQEYNDILNAGIKIFGRDFSPQGYSGYEFRRDGEPPMPKTPTVFFYGDEKDLPEAGWLHIVLYTREQLTKESVECVGEEYDIISINAEMSSHPEKGAPMTPATLLRNAMGSEWGGNGVKCTLDEYLDAVEFWDDHYFVQVA